MPEPRKRALITDLDNTLFDWCELWVNCFSPFLEEVLRISGVRRDTLISEIKAVHQKHGTTEYSFVLEELPSLQSMMNGESTTEVFASAIEIYREQRRKYLRLLPTVAETLLKIKGRGALIVGYTESMGFYSNYRLRRLGLDGVMDFVFCPADHVLPEGLSHDDLRKYPAEYYKLKYCLSKTTPPGSTKPDPEVLRTIIDSLGLKLSECVYIGDSLMKDVAMAMDCGVDGVWAKYGKADARPEYSLLREVTHWTEDAVNRETRINEHPGVTPRHVLERSFSEILDIFQFSDFHV